MLHLHLRSIAKLLVLSCLSLAFFSCQKDDAPETVVPRNDTLVPDPYAAEKAKQWKYSATGSDRASFLINGVHKNISRVTNGIDGLGSFGISILPMLNTKDVDNIDFPLSLGLSQELGKLVEKTFKVPGSPSVVYMDTTCFIPFTIGANAAYGSIYGFSEQVLPALKINRTAGIKTSEGYGRGWIKVTKAGALVPNTRKLAYSGEFEVHIGFNGDSIHYTNGWFDVNVVR